MKANSFFHFIFQASMPFAVVGSNATIEVQGKKVRGRRYPWGVVEGWCCGVRGA